MATFPKVIPLNSMPVWPRAVSEDKPFVSQKTLNLWHWESKTFKTHLVEVCLWSFSGIKPRLLSRSLNFSKNSLMSTSKELLIVLSSKALSREKYWSGRKTCVRMEFSSWWKEIFWFLTLARRHLSMDRDVLVTLTTLTSASLEWRKTAKLHGPPWKR